MTLTLRELEPRLAPGGTGSSFLDADLAEEFVDYVTPPRAEFESVRTTTVNFYTSTVGPQ